MDKSYTRWVQNLVKRYCQCQIKAAIKVNEEQLRFNWLLEHDIVEMKYVIHPKLGANCPYLKCHICTRIFSRYHGES